MRNQQKKIISASDRFGNTNIKKQQGTDRDLFDYVYLGHPPTQPTQIEFFTNCKNHQFPFTNLPTNQLDIGESFLIERIYFDVTIVDESAPGKPVAIVVPLGTGNSGLGLCQYSWFNDNNTVIKNKSLLSHFPEFNDNAFSNVGNIKKFESLISIQPLIPFRCILKLPVIPFSIHPNYGIYVGCHVVGNGKIFAPKHTY